MKKVVVLMLLFSVLVADKSFAQYGRRYYPRYRRYPERNADPYFKPSVYLSIGYGFPNLDKNELLHFYNFYRGNTNQTGPIHAAIDYQFNRSTSVGVMVAYAKASAPYFDNNNTSITPSFNGKLEDWSILFNMVRYIPAGRIVSPYLRTAIGVSLWDEAYRDSTGAKVVNPEQPNMLAYQVSLGTKINFSNQSGIFIEAGYGKYMVSGGLTFKFWISNKEEMNRGNQKLIKSIANPDYLKINDQWRYGLLTNTFSRLTSQDIHYGLLTN